MKRNETQEGRSVRLLRVGEQVRHALSDILMRGDVHDATLASHSVSVTEVRMWPDLRHATAFVMPLMGGDACVRQWHHIGMWFYIVFVIIHVYLAAFHDYVEGRGTMSSIFGGWKFERDDEIETLEDKTE